MNSIVYYNYLIFLSLMLCFNLHNDQTYTGVLLIFIIEEVFRGVKHHRSVFPTSVQARLTQERVTMESATRTSLYHGACLTDGGQGQGWGTYNIRQTCSARGDVQREWRMDSRIISDQSLYDDKSRVYPSQYQQESFITLHNYHLFKLKHVN